MIFPSPINVLCKDLTEESTSTVHRNSLNLNSDLEQCRWFIYSCALKGDTTTTTRRKARKSQPWKWQIIEKERLKNSSSIKNTEKFLVKHCGRRVHILRILYDMKELNMDTGAFFRTRIISGCLRRITRNSISLGQPVNESKDSLWMSPRIFTIFPTDFLFVVHHRPWLLCFLAINIITRRCEPSCHFTRALKITGLVFLSWWFRILTRALGSFVCSPWVKIKSHEQTSWFGF